MAVENVSSPVLTTLVCANCSARTEMEMPTNSCIRQWTCPNCGTELRADPSADGCGCVACRYGTVSCPPARSGDGCC